MPRYFFDTTDAGKTTTDSVGIDLPDDEAARRHVGLVVPGLARKGLPDGELHTFECDARNEAGKIVYRGEMRYRGAPVLNAD